MAVKTRSWWGWGNVEDAVSGGELVARPDGSAPLLAGRRLDRARAPAVEDLEVPASSGPAARPRWPPCVRADPTDRARAQLTARRSATSYATCRPAGAPCPTSSSGPRTEAGRRRRARLVHRRRHRRDPVRRRQLGRRRRRAAIRTDSPGGDPRPRATGPGARDRPDQPGGADPGRRARARISRTSCGRTGSPCGTSRSRSSSRRSAAGWPRGPVATSPRCYTHIDDLTESMRVVTPAGVSESRRLPGSGAGPSPDRLFLGSEGTLGVITEAWMRLQDRPRWQGHGLGALRRTTSRRSTATRAIAQSGLHPANCRLLDPAEALINAGAIGTGGAARARVRVGRPSGRPVDGAGGRAVPRPRRRRPSRPYASRPTQSGRARGRHVAIARSCGCPYQRDALAARR